MLNILGVILDINVKNKPPDATGHLRYYFIYDKLYSDFDSNLKGYNLASFLDDFVVSLF